VPVKTYSVVAKTTPEQAYAYLSDLRRHPEWSPDNLTVEQQGGGDVEVGTRYKTVGHLQGKPNEAIVEITQLAPPTQLSFRSADSNGRSTWLHEFTLTPEHGGTRIDRKVSVVSAPMLLNIIFPLLHPVVIGPGNMKSMGMLKAKLEAGA
jgi:uncharacterized protein YndB with AHSA1/START domain